MAIDSNLSATSPSLSDIPSGIASRLGFTVDILSFFRNSWSVITPHAGTALTAFGAVGGAVMALSSSILTLKAISGIWQAFKKGDYKSVKVLTVTSLPSFASYACVSYGMLIQKVAILANASHIANVGGALLVHALPVMAAFNFLSGAYGDYTTRELRNTLNQKLQSESLKMGIDEGIEFIKAKPWFKAVENGLVCNANPDSPQEKQAFIQEAFTAYLRYKVKNEERDIIENTSQECVDQVKSFLLIDAPTKDEFSAIVRLINESLDCTARTKTIQHIQEICKDENSSAEFARQTSDKCVEFVRKQDFSIVLSSEQTKKDFLCTVYEANYRANLNSRFLQVVAVIGMVASGILFTTMAPQASLIYIGGSLVWMVLDSSRLSKKVGNWFWKHRKVYVLPQSLQSASADLLRNPTEQKKSESTFWLQTIAAGALAPIWMPPAVIYYEGKRVYRNLTDYLECREIAAEGYAALSS